MFHGVGLGQSYPMVSEEEMIVDNHSATYVKEGDPSTYVGTSSQSSSSVVKTDGYCPNHNKMCLTSEKARQMAVDACRVPRVRGYSTLGLGFMGLGRVCTIYHPSHTVKVNESMIDMFSPCHLKTLPLCSAPPIQPQFDPEPPPPEEEDDEDNSFLIGGILAALLVAGGVGYAVFRKKKKGKGKRKGR